MFHDTVNKQIRYVVYVNFMEVFSALCVMFGLSGEEYVM